MRGLSRLQALLLGGTVILATVLLAAAAFPSIVYDQVIWKYVVGPVVADAANQATATYHGVVAERGYNLVNEVVYGLIVIYAITVLFHVLQRYELGRERGFILWFVPFIIFGGLVRVVEDAAILSGPLQYLFISPVIYGTVAAIVIVTLAVAAVLDRRGVVSDYKSVIAGGGIVAVAATTLLLAGAEPVAAAWMLPAGLGLAAVLTAAAVAVAWYGRRSWDGLSAAMTWEGGTVLGGHMIDGSATALSIAVLGYGEKHPVSAFIMDATGTPYSFPVAKAAVILAVLGVMHGTDRDDDPLFYNLVLLGILAVGLGPGVRNLVRAVLGV